MANIQRACMVESDEEDEDGNLTEVNPQSPSKSETSLKGVVDLSDDTSSLQEKETKISKKGVTVLDLCSDTNDSDIQFVDKSKVKIKDENGIDTKDIKLKPEEGDPSLTDELIVESIEDDIDDEDDAVGSLEDDEAEMSFDDDDDEDCEINTDDEEMSGSDSDFEIAKKKSPRKKPTKTKKTLTKVTKNMLKSKFKGSNKKSIVIANEENSEDSSSSSSQGGDEKDTTNSLNKKFIRQKTPICDSIMNDCITQSSKCAPEKENSAVNTNNGTNKGKSVNGPEMPSDTNKVDGKSDSFHAVVVDSNVSKMEQGEVETSGSDPLSVKIKEEIKEEINDENKDDIKLFSTEDTTDKSVACDDESQEGLIKKKTSTKDNNLEQKVQGRKRKRVLKKNEEVLDSSYSITAVNSKTKTQPIHESSPEIEVVKKRRGRPPKNNLSATESSGEPKQILNKKGRNSVTKLIHGSKTTESVNVNESQPRNIKRTSKNKAADNASLEAQSQLNNNVTRFQSSGSQSAETMTSVESIALVADYAISYQKVFDDSFFQNILPLLSEVVMLCMDEFTELLDRQKKAEHLKSEELRQQEIGLAKKSFWTMVATYSEKFFPNFNSVIYKINQTKLKRTLMVSLLVFMANSLQAKAPKFKGSFHNMRKVLIFMCEISKEKDIIFSELLMTNETTFNGCLRQSIKLLMILNKSDILSSPDSALSITSSSDNLDEISESNFSSITNTVSKNQNHSSLKLKEVAAQFVAVLNNKRINSSKRTGEKLNLIYSILEQCNQESSFASSVEETNMLNGNSDENQVGGLDKLLESYLKSKSSADDVKPEIIDLNFESERSNQSVLQSQIVSESNNMQSNEVKVEEVDCANLIHFPGNLIQSEDCSYSTGVSSLSSEQDPLSF